MTKIRLVRNDGKLMTLDSTGYNINITRSIPILSVPVLGERYSIDTNMVKADFRISVILADDDCSASAFDKRAAVASIDFSALKDNSGGSNPIMMDGDGGSVTVSDLNNASFSIETAYTGENTTRKPIKIKFDSSTTSHSKTNNPPVTTVGIQSANTGALIVSRIKTALESSAGEYTDQLTTDGGTDFDEAFTITLEEGINTSAGNAKIIFTAKEKGFAGNNDTPFFTDFNGNTPFFDVFSGGTNRSCKSAGDKLQDLIAYIGNANLTGFSGRPIGSRAPDDPRTLLAEDDELDTTQVRDYIVGIQIPYNSLVTSSTNSTDYTERNLLIITGKSRANEQDSEANNLDVSVKFDPKNRYTGIAGTVSSMSFNYNAGENVYEGDLTFMPIDFMTGT